METIPGDCRHAPERLMYDFIQNINGNDYKWEAKADRMYTRTGNIAVEEKCSGKPSAIFSGIPDFVAYVLNDGVYCWPTQELINLCDEYGENIYGGDGRRAKLILIPFKIFAQHCPDIYHY